MQASDGAAVETEDAGCVAAIDDKQADAEPEGPTRRKAESALRSIGYSRREAEIIMRAGLAALTDGAPAASEQLDPLLQLLNKRTAAVAKGKTS